MTLVQVGGAATELGFTPGWVGYLSDTGILPTLRTTAGQRLFMEEAPAEFAQRTAEPGPRTSATRSQNVLGRLLVPVNVDRGSRS